MSTIIAKITINKIIFAVDSLHLLKKEKNKKHISEKYFYIISIREFPKNKRINVKIAWSISNEKKKIKQKINKKNYR